MSAGEKAARDALRESVEHNRTEVKLASETIRLLTAGVRQEVSDGVAEGIVRAMTDENAERFWLKGFEIAQTQAANRAGWLVLGGLKRVFGISVIVLAVYLFAGSTAAKAILAALTKG